MEVETQRLKLKPPAKSNSAKKRGQRRREHEDGEEAAK